MNFRDLACNHLSQYKVDVLGVQEDGIFPYCGKNKPKSHILPIAYQKVLAAVKRMPEMAQVVLLA